MSRSSFSLSARDVSKSYGDAPVLDRVSVTVTPDTRLGVVGPNGIGKTTLLRILAGLERPDRGRVTRSPPVATVGYLPQEPERHAGEAVIAMLARRAGVAGAEAELHRSAAALAAGADEPRAVEAYSAALERYLALGTPDFRARAEAVGADLGLAPALLDGRTRDLSGGQLARVSLASILLARFDVLLLDEPTNDLDFDGLERLEAFTEEIRGGLVVVSHDRAFLDRAVTSVLEVEEGTRRGSLYAGGWAAYLEAREVARRHAEESYESYRSERGRLRDRLRRQKQWAEQGRARERRRPRDADKAQRDWRINRTEKQAAKVRVTERALARLEVAGPDKPFEPWRLRLDVARAERSGDVVARLERAVVRRGRFTLGPIDFEARWADRVVVAGPNGSGKTTLLRALLGRLPLGEGERWLGPAVVPGELDQARAQFGGERGFLELFLEASRLPRSEARSLLAKFGLGAVHITRAASTLSPGERTRAGLALLMARGVNLLVLDEPTNHLDLPAIEQLEAALDAYDGTLLLVSHDRRLLEAVRLTRRFSLQLGSGGK